jgi:plasmid stabilization system protein ParE
MPRGDKSRYTRKQKRQAGHIEKGYKKRGVSENEAERRAWATVNKQDGGGKKNGSGRKKTASTQGRRRKKATTPSRTRSRTRSSARSRSKKRSSS